MPNSPELYKHRSTFLGLSSTNIAGMNTLYHGLKEVESSTTGIHILGLDWYKFGLDALNLGPFLQNSIIDTINDRRIPAKEVQPYMSDLLELAEDYFLSSSYKSQRQWMLKSGVINVKDYETYRRELTDLNDKKHWLLQSTSLVGFLAPAAFLMMWDQIPSDSKICYGGAGLANGIVTGIITHEITNDIINRLAAGPVAKKLSDVLSKTPVAPTDLSIYRSSIEDLIASDYPANALERDFSKLFDRSRAHAHTYQSVNNNPEEFGKRFIEGLSLGTNEFIENPEKYPFLGSMLNKMQHLLGRGVALKPIYINQRILENANVLSPEIYLATAILAGNLEYDVRSKLVSGNKDIKDEYHKISSSGGWKRIGAMDFSGAVQEKTGVHPKNFGDALIKIATGMSTALPYRKQEVLSDFDLFARDITLLQQKTH